MNIKVKPLASLAPGEKPDSNTLYTDASGALVTTAGAAAGVSSSGSTSSNGGIIAGVDTAGTKWLLVANTTSTPATITYVKLSDGSIGTPVGSFTPDADQKAFAASLTLTVVSIPANVATQLVAANASRQYLAIQVIGTTGINLDFGKAPTVGNGWAIDPAPSTGRQGGAVTWDAGVITQQQVQAIASAATTVVVIEGV
jgi:hypothetical protein